jgi:hypothetical protein
MIQRCAPTVSTGAWAGSHPDHLKTAQSSTLDTSPDHSKMSTVELEAVPGSPMSHERAAPAAQSTWEDLVPATNQISDKGPAVFAFAAYHQLQSGHTVREVVASDGAGHGADPEAIRELEGLGLIARDGDRVSFTDQGEAVLGRVIETIRQAADGRQAAGA